METPAITISNLHMAYRRRLSLRHQEKKPVFKGLSFEVISGETLGIVGTNGAGKSTLLRLIAGILDPDTGTIDRFDNTVSLLSLNLGLDPQLSGVDNAILSAVLLGFSKMEAEKALPSIIEFSELGNAIYEPVKTYSSGMQTRLGFSTALHLKPDILLIDEVLGVGDQRFQQKSSTALIEKITSNQTVILVSHQLPQLERLCTRVLWIEQGKLRRIGPTKEILNEYLDSVSECSR